MEDGFSFSKQVIFSHSAVHLPGCKLEEISKHLHETIYIHGLLHGHLADLAGSNGMKPMENGLVNG